MDDKNKDDQEDVMIDVSSMSLKDKAPISSKGIDFEQLEQAEKIISSMAASYIDWAGEDIKRLQTAYDGLVKDLDNYGPHLKEIFEIAHDMKGQGGSFNYILMTAVGNYLCRFVERIKSQPTPKLLEIIRLHIDAMRMIIGGRITGDGGEAGRKIIKGLEATLVKYIPDTIQATHEKDEKAAAEQPQKNEE